MTAIFGLTICSLLYVAFSVMDIIEAKETKKEIEFWENHTEDEEVPDEYL